MSNKKFLIVGVVLLAVIFFVAGYAGVLYKTPQVPATTAPTVMTITMPIVGTVVSATSNQIVFASGSSTQIILLTASTKIRKFVPSTTAPGTVSITGLNPDDLKPGTFAVIGSAQFLGNNITALDIEVQNQPATSTP